MTDVDERLKDHKSKLSSGSSEPEFLESNSPEKLSERAKEFAQDARTKTYQLAGVLWKIKAFEYYVGLGYDSFGEYIEEEMSFGTRKARALSSLWKVVNNRWGLDIDEIKDIPWSKLAACTEVFSSPKTNIDDEEVNKEVILNLVRETNRDRVRKKTKEFLGINDKNDSRTNDVSDPKNKRKEFRFTKSEHETVETALELASEKVFGEETSQRSRESQAFVLTMICQEFIDNHS